MKKILVPTDFSDNAHQAFLYATKIAEVTEAEVIVLHAYNFVSTDPLFSQSLYETMIDTITGQAEAAMKEYQQKVLPVANTQFTFKTKLGLAVDVIIQEAKQIHADLIVMGTKGSNGLLGNVLGSITSAVIERHELPVLSVANAAIGTFETVVFGADYHEVRNADTLQPMLDLVKAFGSKIHILNANSVPESMGQDYSGEEQLEILLQDYNVCFDYTSEEDVEKALQDCVKQENASLLVMIARHRGFWKGLFHHSLTRSMSLHAHVPLLVLPDL